MQLDPRLQGHFIERIGSPTRLQKEAWKAISEGEDVLVVSPTGSGKTMAALAVPLDSLLKGGSERTGVHVLYITPMKALGHDMVEILGSIASALGPIPVRGRRPRRGAKGQTEGEAISVGIRTADVPQSERRRMLARPPDILVTTPENLLLMLCSSYRKMLATVRYAIVDEVHEMMRSKRGSMLSLCMEYLRSMVEERCPDGFQTIGLSATVSPKHASRYIAGYGPDGRPRRMKVVQGRDDKEIAIEVRTLPEAGSRDGDMATAVTSDIDRVLDLTRGSVVVFRNTRAGAEETAHSLRSMGRTDVAPHHGSLGSELRTRAESDLKAGSLKCIVSSTSLELGIDVGAVDLCVQVSSPGDPTRLVQRFGRAGHGLRRTSKGILYPMDPVDLLDGFAVSMAALRSTEYGATRTIDYPYDVLAQFIVGLSLKEGGTSIDEVLALSRRTSSFRRIRRRDVADIVSLLSERLQGKDATRPRLWSKGDAILPRRNAGQSFYLNSGTIPKESNYRVVEEGTRRVLGELSREFGAALYEGDVIMLGSRPFKVTGFSGSKVRVREDPEAAPTVPRWSGDVPSRPGAVSAEVHRFWEDGPPVVRVRRRGGRTLALDASSARMLMDLHQEGTSNGWAPARSRVPVSVLPRRAGGLVYVFHLPEGRSVTDPLARIIAFGVRKRLGARVDFVATDEGFAIASPAPLTAEDIVSSMDPVRLEDDLAAIVQSSSFYMRSFAQCAARSLLVLSRFGGRETGAMYKRRSLEALMRRAEDVRSKGSKATSPERGLALIREEALRETLSDRLDLTRVKAVARTIFDGRRTIEILREGLPLGTIGKEIVSSWSSDLIGDGAAAIKAGPDIARVAGEGLQWGAGLGQEGASIVHISILTNGPLIPSTADPGALIAEGAARGASPADLSSEGALLMVRLPEGNRFFDPTGIPRGPGPPDRSTIMSWRRRLLLRRKGLKALSESVPFFTDPLEIALRARNLRFDDIRSHLLSGRLVPFPACGGRRVGDPRWALAWEVLSAFRPQRGVDLDVDPRPRRDRELFPREFGDMVHPGTWPLGEGPAEGYASGGSFEAERRLLQVLDELGPMTYDELSRTFSWAKGSVPGALLSTVSNGRVLSALGGSDPTGKGRELAIWFWSSSWVFDVKDGGGRAGAGTTDGWFPATDPYLTLYGRGQGPANDPRVKGARGLEIVYLSGGIESGRAVLSQGGDLVRVHDLEVRDYTRIGEATASLFSVFEGLERLGYDMFTVEGIMGVPATEGPSTARSVLEAGGFKEVGGGSRPLLGRGFPVIDAIRREQVVASMLIHQGLVEGHHLSHPIEVLLLNLGIADRWEVLSRLGSARHRSIPPGLSRRALGLVRSRLDMLKEAVEGGTAPVPMDASDLLTEERETLPEGRDLVRKLDLERGMLDQPDPVWSARPALQAFPPHEGRAPLSRKEREIVSFVRMGSDRSREHPGLSEMSHEVMGLLRRGVLSIDAWGRHHILLDRRKGKRGMGPPGPLKGVMLRAFLLSSASSLGAFSFRDIIALSPGLGPPGRVRAMLSDLCRTHLRRCVMEGPPLEAVYVLKDLDLEAIVDRAEGIASDGRITLISSRDRMARVLSPEFAGTFGRGRGHLVLRGLEPAGLVSFKRAPGGRDEGHGPGKGRLLIGTLRKGQARRTDPLVKDIRRRMFELGMVTVTEEELERDRSLYGPG